jgi:glyoxylase-like metal-dependent hydrolase (beta-lactamase superfamily II)
MILKAVRTGMLESNCYILGNGSEAAVIDPGADHEEIMQVLEEQGLTLKYIIYTHGHIDHVAEGDILRSLTGAKVVAHEDEARILEDPVLNGSAVFWSAREMGSADITVKDADLLKLGNAELEVIHTPGHTPGGICILVRKAVAEESSAVSPSESTVRDAERYTAGSAVESAARNAAGYTEVNTGESAAGHSERYTAGSAVKSAARHSERYTEESAVESAARHSERYTAGSAVESAAGHSERYTAGNAAGHATGSAPETESCIFTGDTLFRLSVGRTDLGAGDPGLLRASLMRFMELDDNVKVYPGHGPATTIGYERANNPWLLQLDDLW